MLYALRREFIYIWYYFELQLRQIFPYWLLGILIGSFVSVFIGNKIHNLVCSLSNKRLGVLGIIPASILGIASPLCMYGTIPLAASFSQSGIRDDWLAAFMMSSILLNPQLIIYTTALGSTALIVRNRFLLFLWDLCWAISPPVLSKYLVFQFFRFCRAQKPRHPPGSAYSPVEKYWAQF